MRDRVGDELVESLGVDDAAGDQGCDALDGGEQDEAADSSGFPARAGASRLLLHARLGSVTLIPGSYVSIATPIADGRVGKQQRATFRILRRSASPRSWSSWLLELSTI